VRSIPVRRALQRPVITTGPGAAPTLANVTGLSPWIVIAVLAAAAGLWMWWARGEVGGHAKWPWPVTGAAVGVMIAVGWWASTYGDRPVGITFAANTGHLLTYPMVGYPTKATWSMWMALGVPVGAFVSAKRAGEFGWKVPPGDSLVKIFAGRPPHGRCRPHRRGLQYQPGAHELATLALGSLLTFAGDGSRGLADSLGALHAALSGRLTRTRCRQRGVRTRPVPAGCMRPPSTTTAPFTTT
jgi:hypothetical protein